MQVSVFTGCTRVGLLVLLYLAGKNIVSEERDLLVLQPWAHSQKGYGMM